MTPTPSEKLGPSVTRRVLLGGALAAGATAAGLELLWPATKKPVVRVFGAAGSFTGLAGLSHLPSGHRVATVTVPSWRFGPGQAAFECAVAKDGSVIMGTTPFTDDQLRPTAADMEIGVLDADGPSFTSVVIPSTTGRTLLPGIGASGLGGADVSGVVALPESATPRVLFVSTAPYHGWDAGAYGELPSIGELALSTSGWRYDPEVSWTADALAARCPAPIAATAFPSRGVGPRDNRGTTAAAVLPRSGHVIVAQYFGSDGGRSGGLLALDRDVNRVRGAWDNPAVLVFGQPVLCHPRQLAADPSSAAGDERFVVIFDTFDAAGRVVPFPIQEFSYRAETGTIRPVSTAVRAAQDGTRLELAVFLADGTLVVARTKPDGLSAATVVVYRKHRGERSLGRYPPADTGGDLDWGRTCQPDTAIAGTDRGGLVRSLSVDPQTGRVFLAGLNGLLQTVEPPADRASGQWRAAVPVDLALDLLRTPQHYPIGIRQGAVDERRRLLWLPCNQLTLGLTPWPVTPFALDQWIFAIAIDAIALAQA